MGPDSELYVQRLVFFDDMKVQVIKINVVDKAVPAEFCPGMAFEFPDIGVEPDGPA